MDTADQINNYQTSCDLKLTDGVYDYYVLPTHATADPESRIIRYTTAREAENLIEASISCTGETHNLQNFVSKHSHGSAWSCSDKKLQKQAAALIINRDIVIQSRTATNADHGTFAAKTQPKNNHKNYSIGSLLPDHGNSVITYKIVEDQPGDFIPGVLLTVTLTEGRYKELVSAHDGKVIIENVKRGVSGFNLDVSNIFSATLENTFAYVTVNSNTTKPEQETPNKAKRVHFRLKSKSRQKLRYVADIKVHQVAEGQTFSSIAKDNNSTFRDLAFFNWGTYEKKRILESMERDIGCKNKAPDGRDFQFSGNESPGIVYIPVPRSVSDLKTSTEHTIRVTKVGYNLTYLYKVDPDDPELKNDTITLLTDDNAWEYTLCIKDLEEVEENWVKLIFPNPPKEKKYSLIRTPGDEKKSFYIFESLSYDLIQFDENRAFNSEIFV